MITLTPFLGARKFTLEIRQEHHLITKMLLKVTVMWKTVWKMLKAFSMVKGRSPLVAVYKILSFGGFWKPPKLKQSFGEMGLWVPVSEFDSQVRVHFRCRKVTKTHEWAIFRISCSRSRTISIGLKNLVQRTENWPLQICHLAHPDRTIWNKIMIQFGWIVVMFILLCIGY
jgi:hypothetical protein